MTKEQETDQRIREAEQEQAEQEAAIKNMTAAELLEMIEETEDATNVVLEGFYNYANSISAGAGVSIAAIVRLRNTTEAVKVWIQDKFDLISEDTTVSPTGETSDNGEIENDSDEL